MNVNVRNDMVIPPGAPETHFWLTRSVARAMGVNLSKAMASGRMSADEYAQMIERCRCCALVMACQAWLATEAMQRRAAHSDCVIRDRLEELR